MVSTLIPRQLIRPQSQCHLCHNALISEAVSGVCPWLGAPWLNWLLSLALSVCNLTDIFFTTVS